MRPKETDEHNRVEILIVEDSPTQAECLKHILEEQGYQVSVAYSGKKALASISEHKPRIVISDILMPEMDGYQLCQQIKANEALRDLPVILLTALSNPQDVVRGLECGADNFMVKPCDEKHLLFRIQHILANQELRKKDKVQMGVEILFRGQKYFIAADRLQILDLLLSTYEAAVEKNDELIEAQNELRTLNEVLEKKVEERTAALTAEITERQRAEVMLRQLSSIVESSDDAIISKSLDGTILSWNKGAERLYGYSAGEAQDQPISIILPHDYPDELPGIMARLKRGEGVEHFETERMRKDGQRIYVSLTISPIREVEGNIVGASAIARDITDRKRAEEEIRRLNAVLEQRVVERTAQLEAANKELEAFSYSASHDLRAPLRAIDGFSRILLEEHAPQLSPEGQRYLRLVRANAQRMGDLIDDLLTFSRLSRQPLRMQPILPADLVRQVLEDLRMEQEGRRVEIVIGDLPACQADPTLLRQVLVNLLSNALKFTRQREVARMEVGWRREGHDPLYFIKDNGAGFDMHYADKLFGVFQRLHRVEEYEGTGVGLAIVQRIIHRHGGRIWADAKVNQGATFYFTLGGDDLHD
ncbi:MAG: PAS domain S-box protein [Acidobacteria bacterium]|nr:PAS domain S-box protein [Acidobacteriota bacterium]